MEEAETAGQAIHRNRSLKNEHNLATYELDSTDGDPTNLHLVRATSSDKPILGSNSGGTSTRESTLPTAPPPSVASSWECCRWEQGRSLSPPPPSSTSCRRCSTSGPAARATLSTSPSHASPSPTASTGTNELWSLLTACSRRGPVFGSPPSPGHHPPRCSGYHRRQPRVRFHPHGPGHGHPVL